MDQQTLLSTFQYFVTVVSVLGAILGVVSAIRSGALRLSTVIRPRRSKHNVGETLTREKAQALALIKIIAQPDLEKVRYEEDQLSQYYAQILSQSKTSYWFGQVFASIGILVIIIAIFVHSNNVTESNSAMTAAIMESVAGIVMSAVGTLFFRQSGKKDEMWRIFLKNLRDDRKIFEALKLCDTVADPDKKDTLKIALAVTFVSGEPISQAVSTILSPAFPSGLPAPAAAHRVRAAE